MQLESQHYSTARSIEPHAVLFRHVQHPTVCNGGCLFWDVCASHWNGLDLPHNIHATGHLKRVQGALKCLVICRGGSMGTTLPKTTWTPSKCGVAVVVMKNCEPFESGKTQCYGALRLRSEASPGPEFAIERYPGPLCFSAKLSSCKQRST